MVANILLGVVFSFCGLVSFICFCHFCIISVYRPYKARLLSNYEPHNKKGKAYFGLTIIGSILFMYGGFKNSIEVSVMVIDKLFEFDAAKFIVSLSLLLVVASGWVVQAFSDISEHIVWNDICRIKENEIENIINSGLIFNSYSLSTIEDKIHRLTEEVSKESMFTCSKNRLELDALNSVVILFNKINKEIEQKFMAHE